MKVKALLREKSRPVHTISCNRTVGDAVTRMADKRVSALIVMDGDRPAGIFTERDIFRYFLRDRNPALSEIPLQNAMTDKLILAAPEDDIRSVINIMIKSDIKHLPVMAEKRIIALLTLNELVEHQIDSLTEEIHQLQDYIDDLHEAGRD